MNTNASLHCFEQITFYKWNWEQIIMETAEFTIFNNELRFHFRDQNLLDLKQQKDPERFIKSAN